MKRIYGCVAALSLAGCATTSVAPTRHMDEAEPAAAAAPPAPALTSDARVEPWAGPFPALADAAFELEGAWEDLPLELASADVMEAHRLEGQHDEFGGYQVVLALKVSAGWYSKTWTAEQHCQHYIPSEEAIIETAGSTSALIFDVRHSVQCDRDEGYEDRREYQIVGLIDGAVVDIGTLVSELAYSSFYYGESASDGQRNSLPIDVRCERAIVLDQDVFRMSAPECELRLPAGVAREDARTIQNLRPQETLTMTELTERGRVGMTTGDPVWGSELGNAVVSTYE